VLALRPDVIKIDVSIIRGIDDDPGRREFVRALVSFSRATGCTLVAEGIETQEELAAVRALGVGCGQGFHLGRPARAAAGPWQLSLPPLRGANLPQLKGRWGRVARPVAVLIAATLAWPGIVAVAGLRAPWAVERVVDRVPAEPQSSVGGSTHAPSRAPGPATLLQPVTRTATAATVPVISSTHLPKTEPPVKAPAVTDSVTGVVDVVDQTVGSVLHATQKTVKTVTKTAGSLLGTRRSIL
jgi:EAL domain-containing protein